jgi:hypothetical protein
VLPEQKMVVVVVMMMMMMMMMICNISTIASNKSGETEENHKTISNDSCDLN